jgi:dTMP kinase
LTRGSFITIEGVEGVGKSTNIAFIRSLLEERSIASIVTREPGGTELGEHIRNLLLDKEQSSMTAMTELLLMFAARAQHVSQVIEPGLASGSWVICDRFTDSSYAYQGGGRHIDMDTIASLEQLAINSFHPDCTLVLDLPVEIGLKRALDVGEKDRFESEKVEFFERVRQVFLQRAAKNEYSHVVDTSQPLEGVQSDIRAIIEPMLNVHCAAMDSGES